jgi:hypothetical protein
MNTIGLDIATLLRLPWDSCGRTATALRIELPCAAAARLGEV